ncbi:hypothetical protein L6164_036628 [Bauhinia variegata]|uniref:Uncharacterized protein n=1 Tax=Bauhinia variegata TaxID=167791 RepID=A0ACB9KHN8_BAUVA|nr:hypothetical protein L6164_036628 [Bauhinia variegata]
MGLSSKQVSSSGLDWNQTLLQAQDLELPKPTPPLMRKQQQQNQQQSEALKCPRCDSSNTKFCYYNNYNKSQPRHFCRTCKRHWTKGGTLRNVPVGGGRKNKRVKKSTNATSSATTSSNSTTTVATTTSIGNLDAGLNLNTHMAIHPPQQRHSLSLALGGQKNLPPSLYQTLIRPPSLLPQHNHLMNTRNLESKDFGTANNGLFLGSTTLPLAQNQNLHFPFSSSASFDTNPCSVSTSLRSSSVYNYGEELKTMEEPTINSLLTSTTSGTNTQPWEMPATCVGMEMSNYWSWEDLDSLVSTDLNVPWEDSDLKP